MRSHAGLKFSFLLAALIHAGIVVLFTFTLSSPPVSAKPAFVFLGSFLRQQEVELPSENQPGVRTDLDVRSIRLDSAQGALPFGVGKPSLVQKAAPGKKTQYKPVVTESIFPAKSSSTDADLGIELEPPPPVRMKINRND